MASDDGATSQETTPPQQQTQESEHGEETQNSQNNNEAKSVEPQTRKKKNRVDDWIYKRNLRKLEKFRKESGTTREIQTSEELPKVVEENQLPIEEHSEEPIVEKQQAAPETSPIEPELVEEEPQKSETAPVTVTESEEQLPVSSETEIIDNKVVMPEETGEIKAKPEDNQPSPDKGKSRFGFKGWLGKFRPAKHKHEETASVKLQETAAPISPSEPEVLTQSLEPTVVEQGASKPDELPKQPEENIQEQVAQANALEPIESIKEKAESPPPITPTRALITIGEYPIHLALKGPFTDNTGNVLPLFIDKSSLDILKWSQAHIDEKHIIGLDAELDTHFWFNITQSLETNNSFMSRLNSQPFDKLKEALIVSSVWDGVGSALLPAMISQLNLMKIRSVALTLIPGKVQPIESQFNAFSAIGRSIANGPATLVLIDRDNLESYVGVDRKGQVVYGDEATNYLLDILLSKETFVEELCELSETFSVPLYTLYLATAGSFKIYGSIANMLDTTLLKPLLTFDLSSAAVIYVLVRMPYRLKDKLPRAKIETAVANWFSDKATLKSIYITEPVYIDDPSDRVDIALFIGGFETAKRFSAQEKRINSMKNQAVKRGSLKEEEWEIIVKTLTE
jgi:hypothetical protein